MKQLLVAAALFVSPAQAQNMPDFTFDSLDGGVLYFSDFTGQTLLIVNTASFCGFTPQYEALQALDDARPDVTVIGLPTDDFGQQEHDTNAQVAAFCELTYGITFPMSEIVTTRGPAAHPFFAWARDTGGAAAQPRWNFHKWVISADGTLVASFGASATPDSAQIATALADAAR